MLITTNPFPNRKTCLLLSALFLLPVLAVGQTDSLEQQILDYAPSKSEIISKGRRLILDSFMADDLDKVEEVKDYLLREVEDENYMALYPAEHWLLLYWTEEFEELLPLLQGVDENFYGNLYQKIQPSQDRMFAHIHGKSVAWKTKLEWKISKASLEQEEKDFLQLNLEWLLSDESQADYLDKLNRRADLFLAAYPESEYEGFVRQELRYKYVPSDWGLGMEFFAGYGLFNGELADSFTNPVVIGFGFDGEYRKFTLNLRMALLPGKTAKELSNRRGDIWQKGEPTNGALGEITLGYAILESDKIKFSPFAGIGVAEITAPENDLKENPGLERLAVGSDVAYSLGGNLDFKLGWNTGEIVENKSSYWYLRFRYAYVMPQFSGDPQGNMHTFSLGLGAVFRKLKREL